jgi:hypothetical protein
MMRFTVTYYESAGYTNSRPSWLLSFAINWDWYSLEKSPELSCIKKGPKVL